MELKGTTIVAVQRDGKIAIAGDGQVTAGQSTILKSTAVKVRRLYEGKVIAGFAGTVADAFTLFEKFESMLQKFSGNLMRSAVELAQHWRGDNILRKLEAMLIVADTSGILVLDGVGDVVEPDGGVAAIGSGGNFALSAARALVRNTEKSARDIAEEAIRIASEICVYTNDNITIEEVQ